MAEWTTKVQPGSRMRGMPAKAYNKFIDAAQYVENQLVTAPNGGPAKQEKEKLSFFRNNLSVELARGYIIGLDGVDITPTDNQDEYDNHILFKMAEPDAALHANSWGIVYDDMPAGNDMLTGRFTVSGPAITKVNMISDEHKFCNIITGTYENLVSDGSSGYPILWADAGTGVKDAVVLVGHLDSPRQMIAYNNSGETIPANSVAEVTGPHTISAVEQLGWYDVVKPTGNNLFQAVVIPNAIAAGDSGICFFPGDTDRRAWAECDVAVAIGDDIGTASGSWEWAKDNTGHKVVSTFGGGAYSRPFRATTAATSVKFDINTITNTFPGGLSNANGSLVAQGSIQVGGADVDISSLNTSNIVLCTKLRGGAGFPFGIDLYSLRYTSWAEMSLRLAIINADSTVYTAVATAGQDWAQDINRKYLNGALSGSLHYPLMGFFTGVDTSVAIRSLRVTAVYTGLTTSTAPNIATITAGSIDYLTGYFCGISTV